MLSDSESTSHRPYINLLALDGGGAQGLSSLIILRELMQRVAIKQGIKGPARPSDYFDLITGTGTGGISALFLGRMRMTVDEAIAEYMRVAETAFRPSSAGFTRLMGGRPALLDGDVLQRTVGDIVQRVLGGRNVCLEVPSYSPTHCRTAILASSSTSAEAPPYVFRSYHSGISASLFTIHEVARATVCSAGLFAPVSLGKPRVRFIDYDLSSYTNPTQVCLAEAATIWPGRHIHCVVSLGTGLHELVGVTKGWSEVSKVCAAVAERCEQMHNRVFSMRNRPLYFRFNVDRGQGAMDIIEWRTVASPGKLPSPTTDSYLRLTEVQHHLDSCALCLGPMNLQHLQDLAIIPELGYAVYALVKLYDSLENVRTHQDQCGHLRSRCMELLLALRAGIQQNGGSGYKEAVDEAAQHIDHISDWVQRWSTLEETTVLFRQSDIHKVVHILTNDLIYFATRLIVLEKISELQLGWAAPFDRNSDFCLDGRITRGSQHPVASGGFGDIWEGLCNDQKVAIKTVRPWARADSRNPLTETKLRKRAWREYAAWSSLSHPNVLELLGFSYEFSPTPYLPCFISPWMSNGCVSTYLMRSTDVDYWELLVGIADGLSYLHAHNPAIVHGDLRASNILVSDLGVPCLCDFGLSRILGEAKGMTTTSEPTGSLRWMSPELLHEDRGVSMNSDIWAFGMTVLEICSGKHPYCAVNSDVIVFGQIKDGNTPPRPEDPQVFKVLTDEIWDICQQCWSLSPQERPPMLEINRKLRGGRMTRVEIEEKVHERRQKQEASRKDKLEGETRAREEEETKKKEREGRTSDRQVGDRLGLRRDNKWWRIAPRLETVWDGKIEVPRNQQPTAKDKIESQLQHDLQMAKNEIKMLLLGTNESAKANFLKQMKLIHQGGYNDSERQAHKEIIFHNTIQGMRMILEAMPMLDLSLEPANFHHRVYIMSQPFQFDGEALPRDVADSIRGLWRDPGIREAVRRSPDFQLAETSTYYFNAIDRMSAPGYLPTDQDILRSRVKTTGITETRFRVGELTYKLFDISGQRSERKKWIHCFENITALVFVVSLSEYDEMLYEDENVTRMQESLTFFDSICNSRWFANTNIILLLHDVDIFAEKLPHSPLGNYFPDYTGGDDYDAACDYLLHRFVSLNQGSASKQIFAHYTHVTDTQNFKSIQDILLQRHLREKGLLKS